MTTIKTSKLRIGPVGLALSAALAVAAIAFGGEPVRADQGTVPQAGAATFRRLSEDQYKRSIAQIFGADIKVPGRFEPPVREEGMLAIGQSHVVVTPAGFEQYALRAREISAQVLDDKHRGQFLQCPAQASFNEACARQFFGKYGLMLFRRPLKDSEMASTLKLARAVTVSSGTFDEGVRAGLNALLNSPVFVFRLETSEPDPQRPSLNRLDAYSLASRVSFLLWDSPPDAQLLAAAGDGSLHKPEVLQREVDRMIASPRLEQGVRAFFSDMFAYDQFEGLSKDSKIYPIFNPQLRDDAREQSLRTVTDLLLTHNGDYRDLFTTRKTFLSRSLGALYGVRVDASAFGGWMPYTIPADAPHSGILTLPAFLMLDPSHEGRSSPTIRGKMVRENLLCQPVPAPPANVNFNLVQDVNDPVHKTARERLTAHQDNPVCAGCHAITDPIGLSLENYTPVGSFRAQENGVDIDASGEFEGQHYKNAIELMNYLRNGPTAASCVVQRVAEYGVGRKLSPAEENWVGSVDENFGKNGYEFKALLRDVATSPTFQAVARPTLAAK